MAILSRAISLCRSYRKTISPFPVGQLRRGFATYSWGTYSTAQDFPPYKKPMPEPDGGLLVDLVAPEKRRAALQLEAEGMPAVRIRPVDLQWLHVLADGWATPLTGFMRKFEYLQALHFGSLRVHPHGHLYYYGRPHDGAISVPMSLPIVLPIDGADKEAFESSLDPYECQGDIALLGPAGDLVAVMRGADIHPFNKREMIIRTWGENALEMPYVKEVISPAGDWLIGGCLEVLEPIKYNDGVDDYRLSPQQLRKEFDRRDADAVYAFHLRGPLHNGHRLSFNHIRDRLLKVFKNPILLLHCWLGLANEDNLPLTVLVEQCRKVLEDGVLDPATTVMAIFPSPMNYVGPTEVQWHAKAVANAGANFYLTRVDPDEQTDLFFDLAPGLEKINVLPYISTEYDTKKKKMDFVNPGRPDDVYLCISETEMRRYALKGESPPPGFMCQSGWDVLATYYGGV